MTAPKFTPRLTLGEGDTTFDGSEWAKGRAVPMWLCEACGDIATLDDPTGLCKPCWRVWRFGDASNLVTREHRGPQGTFSNKLGEP